MTTDSDFAGYVSEQLVSLRISQRRFFGGHSFSSDGLQFAMIIDGTLYFVVDDETRPRYEAMGSHCFVYEKKDRKVDVRRYFHVPSEALEDQEQLLVLARESIGVAWRRKDGLDAAKKSAKKKTARRKTVSKKTAKKKSVTRVATAKRR
jgi:DNA transformation protein and related proteins